MQLRALFSTSLEGDVGETSCCTKGYAASAATGEITVFVDFRALGAAFVARAFRGAPDFAVGFEAFFGAAARGLRGVAGFEAALALDTAFGFEAAARGLRGAVLDFAAALLGFAALARGLRAAGFLAAVATLLAALRGASALAGFAVARLAFWVVEALAIVAAVRGFRALGLAVLLFAFALGAARFAEDEVGLAFVDARGDFSVVLRFGVDFEDLLLGTALFLRVEAAPERRFGDCADVVLVDACRLGMLNFTSEKSMSPVAFDVRGIGPIDRGTRIPSCTARRWRKERAASIARGNAADGRRGERGVQGSTSKFVRQAGPTTDAWVARRASS